MGLSKTPKAHLIFDYIADEQDTFDGMGGKIEYSLEIRHQDQMKIDKILGQIKGGFSY